MSNSGNDLPVYAHYAMNRPPGPVCTSENYARAVADALAHDFQRAPHGIKRIMACTHAGERTVKYWLSGATGPSGIHLVSLAAHSDAVHAALLRLAGRAKPNLMAEVSGVRRLVSHALHELDRIAPQPDCPMF